MHPCGWVLLSGRWRDIAGVMSTPFAPHKMTDMQSGEWSFNELPIYVVLAEISETKPTGQLRLLDLPGRWSLFFRQGLPVGVALDEICAPLGHLLLELGRVNAHDFVAVQRRIESSERLPGQAYIEQGVLDAEGLKEVLAIQAMRKAQRFIERSTGTFEFTAGLAALSGFSAAMLNGQRLLLLALQQHFNELAREDFLQAHQNTQIRAVGVQNWEKEDVGYGHPELRFLTMLAEWQQIDDLDKFGTLTRSQMGLLLKFLSLRGCLQVRPVPEVLPLAQSPEEENVFAVDTVASTSLPPHLRSVQLDKAKPRKPEKTERVSMDVQGWSEPREAKIEKTVTAALPSIVVDYGSLDGEDKKN